MPFLLPGSRRPSTKQIGLVFRQFSGFAVGDNQNKELVQRRYCGNDYFTRINSTPIGSHGGTTRSDNVGPIHTIQSDLRTKAVQEKRCYSIYRTTMEWAFWQCRAPLEDSLRGWAILNERSLYRSPVLFPRAPPTSSPRRGGLWHYTLVRAGFASSFHSSASIPLGM
jgi:hypothetical protein